MSPSSAGATLEVERYVGACLISHHRVKTRDYLPQNLYRRQGNHQGWAGGMPLISFANHQRRGNRRNGDVDESTPLSRLAVHTQGAPLILTKTYNNRKNKPPQSTRIFEQTPKHRSPTGVDAISVTSDESSGSQGNDNFLPRIIKPRKRRKKERKPPHLTRPSHQELDTNRTPLETPAYFPLEFGYRTVGDVEQFLEFFGDIPEAPKLHHKFEDVEEMKDVNGNQPTTTCQCRYCDPAGQIWDVDRSCYSPFLTPPTEFKFPNLNLDGYSKEVTSPEYHCLLHSLSSVSLEDEDEKTKRKMPFSRSSSSSSSSTSSRDLEVSTEIVTSLNGHRDLEIKFFSASVQNDVDNVCRTTDDRV